METIGKYRVIAKIGQGAMGVVYKALDPGINRVLAVKTMSADLASEPELRQRFEREARTAGRLSHKHLITIYDLFEEHGRIFIAMEYLEGEELKSKISRAEPMSLERRLRWMRELSEGLDHAHQKEIVHRDIKPGNIFITRRDHVKILDFGIARIASSELTKSGMVMGTPNYMSPEQVMGKRVDHRSDIFSAGAVLYELLTSRKPFTGKSYHDTFTNIVTQDPEPLQKVEPTLPPELNAIVVRALVKDPSHRYQRMKHFTRDINQMAKTLDSRRYYIQRETLRVVDALDGLLRENSQRLEPFPTVGAAKEFVRWVRQRLDAKEKLEPVRVLDPDPGYLESVEMHTRAVRACERIATRVLRAKEREAASASAPRQEAPVHPPVEERHVTELLSKAQAFYQRGELQRALSVVDGVRDLDPNHEGAKTLHSRVSSRLAEQRLEEERARQAAELFQTAAAKFETADPAACLPLLSEIFRLQPDHLEATALQEKVQEQIKEAADRNLRKIDPLGKGGPLPPK